MGRHIPPIPTVLLLAAHLVSAVAWAQDSAGTLASEELRNLVRGKTWAMDFGGGGGSLLAFWDFRVDGSLCGRFRGAELGSRCADTGKWNQRDDTLCWDFNWFGETLNFKSVCGQIRKADGNAYVVIDQAGKLPPLRFHPVTQSNERRK